MPMIWNFPNLLTVMRLVAAPGIVIMFLYFSRPLADWIALVLFLVAAISDWFDGYMAGWLDRCAAKQPKHRTASGWPMAAGNM